MADRAEAIRGELEPIVAALGLELYDLSFQGGSRATLTVLVDRPGGVDLDAITAATEALSPVVDRSAHLRGPFALEVSSPGVERPLRRREHFAGALGSAVVVMLRDDEGRPERVRGVLRSMDDTAIALDTAVGERRVPMAAIEQARTVFEWGPAPKPGKGSRPGRAKREALA